MSRHAPTGTAAQTGSLAALDGLRAGVVATTASWMRLRGAVAPGIRIRMSGFVVVVTLAPGDAVQVPTEDIAVGLAAGPVSSSVSRISPDSAAADARPVPAAGAVGRTGFPDLAAQLTVTLIPAGRTPAATVKPLASAPAGENSIRYLAERPGSAIPDPTGLIAMRMWALDIAGEESPGARLSGSVVPAEGAGEPGAGEPGAGERSADDACAGVAVPCRDRVSPPG